MPDLDLLGIGIGPANLSLAALAEPLTGLRARFMDARAEFRWHPGLMLPSSQLTVTFFRDLVSLVDPTNECSFMNFLVRHGRAFQFLEANGVTPSRLEFEQYYRWAATRLTSLSWGRNVESVELDEDRFLVTFDDGDQVTAGTLVLGSGSRPHLPSFARGYAGARILHSSELMTVSPRSHGRRVLVVGAGQSGAEVVSHLIADEDALPAELTWLTSGVGFQPLDDSPFTNEWFSANHATYFSGLAAERRAAVLREQRRAGGDGITDSLLGSIYRRVYHLDHVAGSALRRRLLTSRRAVGLTAGSDGVTVEVRDLNRDVTDRMTADLVIFCTGYRSGVPEYLKPIRHRLAGGGDTLPVREDYSLDLDAPATARIFVQGLAEESHGLNDTLLSLAAWRSARILNAVTGREVYRATPGATAVTWDREWST